MALSQPEVSYGPGCLWDAWGPSPAGGSGPPSGHNGGRALSGAEQGVPGPFLFREACGSDCVILEYFLLGDRERPGGLVFSQPHPESVGLSRAAESHLQGPAVLATPAWQDLTKCGGQGREAEPGSRCSGTRV